MLDESFKLTCRQSTQNLAKTIITLLLLLFATPAWAETYSAQVVGISDGDTITVFDSYSGRHKIRLLGIDAPEKSQAFGQKSKSSLSALLFAKTIIVEAQKHDQYGRELGQVLIEGKDANLEQVRRGMAWWYRHYQKDQSQKDRALYAEAEQDAKAAKRGLWQDTKPTPPWEYRRKKRMGQRK